MIKLRILISVTCLVLASALLAQEPKTPAAPGFDAQACAKHCQEMAAAHQKMMEARKAAMEKHQAAWKEIEAQLETAKKSRGDKKVAALETAMEKLLAFHEAMQKEMGAGPMMGGGMMGCCGQSHMGMGMDMDCPMMKGMSAPDSSHKH